MISSPKNGKITVFLLLKMFVKSVQNQSLSSEIGPEKSHEIDSYLPIVFQRNLSWTFQQNFPRNQTYFLWICLWKSSKIELFFHNLSEALIFAAGFNLTSCKGMFLGMLFFEGLLRRKKENMTCKKLISNNIMNNNVPITGTDTK